MGNLCYPYFWIYIGKALRWKVRIELQLNRHKLNWTDVLYSQFSGKFTDVLKSMLQIRENSLLQWIAIFLGFDFVCVCARNATYTNWISNQLRVFIPSNMFRQPWTTIYSTEKAVFLAFLFVCNLTFRFYVSILALLLPATNSSLNVRKSGVACIQYTCVCQCMRDWVKNCICNSFLTSQLSITELHHWHEYMECISELIVPIRNQIRRGLNFNVIAMWI